MVGFFLAKLTMVAGIALNSDGFELGRHRQLRLLTLLNN
jgi:hypothetical protein